MLNGRSQTRGGTLRSLERRESLLSRDINNYSARTLPRLLRESSYAREFARVDPSSRHLISPRNKGSIKLNPPVSGGTINVSFGSWRFPRCKSALDFRCVAAILFKSDQIRSEILCRSPPCLLAFAFFALTRSRSSLGGIHRKQLNDSTS
jgi:hypothetical protein